MLESLILLAFIAAIGWFWQDSASAREVAVAAARTACQRESLQFLDDTVAQRGLRLMRTERGHLALQRSFGFEYSETGDDRQPGLVVILGREIVLLQTGRTPPRPHLTLIQ
ncbi:DUF3301 domain-containing protein [Uliginosibacterium paludis]|uniref:DUF3301 domain-containing protein n=1 Tax=Uliginosibacterium paludis TaxID=1615952 RepID=A0ABV2CVX3_9RHOO